MPKCLDCGNTKLFSYTESSYNEAEYSETGDLVDVFHNHYHPIEDGECMNCHSKKIEGDL